MFSVRLFCFFLTLPSFLGRPDAQRLPVDNNLRGNSFGLENFLFQPYEIPQIKDTVRISKPKRVRPVTNPRVPSDRGQTYGLENINAQVYESSRLKPSIKPIQEHPKRRPVEPVAETKIKENFVVTPETVVEMTPEPPQNSTQMPERIRKRIMMRRRRKRPSSAAQQEGNSDITGNAILQPLRIPIYPQVPKVVVRTKLPDTSTKREQFTMAESTVATEWEEVEKATEKPKVSTTTSSTTTSSPSTINLKTFLKLQTETLSLSELLQTQNLSLADLLRGNKDASAILKVRQSISTTTSLPSTTPRRKQFNRLEPEKPKPLKNEEVIEATTSRGSYNGFQPKIPRIKTSEPTIIKPTEDNREVEVAKPIKRPTYTTDQGIDTQNRISELRLKLRNYQKKTTTTTTTTAAAPVTQIEMVSQQPVADTLEPFSTTTTYEDFYKKNRIPFKSTNNPDLSLIIPNKIKPEPEIQKRPERLTNWTSRLPAIKRFGQDRVKFPEAQKKPLRVQIPIEDVDNKSIEEEVETTSKPEIPDEDIRKPEPKDELIELLKSGQNADRLQKILHSRNMTLQELLDNREKPPPQMNISTLFTNQKKPSTIKPTLFDSLPDFHMEDLSSDASEYDEPEAEESAPSIARVELIPSREPKQFEFPVPEKGVSNLQPDDPLPDTSTSDDSALWKLSEKAISYGSSYGYGAFPAVQQSEKPKTVKPTQLTDDDIILLETLRKSQENRKFKLDITDFIREEVPQETEDIEKSYIPPAVKSAIIASGVVMGIALFVFIAIFAACGWKQRQVRLKGTSSVLGGTLGKSEKSKRTLSPVSFKDTHSYKKTLDFDDETSESGTSNTSSYLWSTLKNTFTSRASTLKSRLEKEEKLKEDKVTLRRNESRRKESRADDDDDDLQLPEEVYTVKKIDRDRNVINTSFNFKRSQSSSNANHFNECVHGY